MRITENYCRQELDEDLASVPRHGDGPRRVRFTHILNPYPGRTPQARGIQQVTFETLRMAAQAVAPHAEVRCVCAVPPDETHIVPSDFIAAGTLTRTVQDVAKFQVRRAMPLIFDILDSGIAVVEKPAEIPDCEDYIVFTNMDIHLQPCFYLVLLDFIREGYDIIDVHRRTIPEYEPSIHLLPSMFAELGVHHGGLDCIAFPRRKYSSFVKNEACVGMSLVMKGVLFNCAVMAKRFLVLSNAHLTFHLGNERAWAHPLFNEYEAHNLSESKRVVRAMSTDKSAALRVVAALKTLQMKQDFLSIAEEGAGIEPAPPRNPFSLRQRLVRKAMQILSRWE